MRHNRQLLGLSQAKLAERVVTATNYISKIESKKQFPSIPMLEKIADALNIDTIELFSTKLTRQDYKPGAEQEISGDIQGIVAETLAIIERDLYENTKKIQELREMLKKQLSPEG
jgi:transcriptional regulator with XRE-family HTH domain